MSDPREIEKQPAFEALSFQRQCDFISQQPEGLHIILSGNKLPLGMGYAGQLKTYSLVMQENVGREVGIFDNAGDLSSMAQVESGQSLVEFAQQFADKHPNKDLLSVWISRNMQDVTPDSTVFDLSDIPQGGKVAYMLYELTPEGIVVEMLNTQI